ncbi:Hypothetical predicted protein [Cloeon dipterum]|uniref:TGF-beta family profile domain-containing protein n=2 Tax=Cloeon dipterum TaxID=197152 RepID=A0A8S1DQN2_9INSE|nr:Hypothetical predicted protein [Cloeon dipterum]
MRFSLSVLLLVGGWFAAPANAASTAPATVPLYLKFMADQAERYESGHSNPGQWQRMASSVAPHHVHASEFFVKMKFLVPNDEWSLQENRSLLLVLTPRANHDENLSVVVRGLEGDRTPWQMTTPLSVEKNFLKLNLTEHIDPKRQELLQLELLFLNEGGRQVDPDEAVIVTGLEHGPLLVITENNDESAKRAVRPRRMTAPVFPHGLPGCRLEHWAPEATQVGWADVVYPRTLRLNLCVGQCPRPVLHHSLKPSSHALARSAFKSRHAQQALNYPDVQCVPIRFRPTSLVLELSKGNYTLVLSEDLAAMDCGCR